MLHVERVYVCDVVCALDALPLLPAYEVPPAAAVCAERAEINHERDRRRTTTQANRKTHTLHTRISKRPVGNFFPRSISPLMTFTLEKPRRTWGVVRVL